jgi:hypothetical protein
MKRTTIEDYARRGLLPSIKLAATAGSCARTSRLRSVGFATAIDTRVSAGAQAAAGADG